MSRLIFDLETDGFLDVVTVIHCLVIKDLDTGEVWKCFDYNLEHGIRRLQNADCLIGHNIIKYDLAVIKKLYHWFTYSGQLRDTLVMTRLIWPELKKKDGARVKAGKYPGNLVGKHSLEAWGYRLGNYKGDYKGPWDTLSQEMLDYCVQDVEVTSTLFARCEKENYSAEAIELEQEVTAILMLQEQHGFAFDETKAGELYATLKKRQGELEDQLKAAFPPWEIYSTFIPKVNSKARGQVKGVAFKKVKVIEFNPGSRDHIADRLMKVYGWEPEEFTKDGKPKVDESTMEFLTYPPMPLIKEYLMIAKRIGALAEGKGAWLKYVKRGRIHGGVTSSGTVTRRMAHMSPNVSQVPAVDAPYGTECRGLFTASPGKVLVGIDASGVQLRCLAHYLAKWDEGAYVKAVTEGDVHTLNWEAGKPYLTARQMAKHVMYAELFGAQAAKIGKMIGQGKKAGQALKDLWAVNIKGFGQLKKKLKAAAKLGYLIALDGGRVTLRSAHAALAALLQAAEAVIMKKALVLLYAALTARGWSHGRDYAFVANVHDEWQIETSKENADAIGQLGAAAIRDAGLYFNFRCPLAGEYKIGPHWAATH